MSNDLVPINLLSYLRQFIDEARIRVTRAVNTTMVDLYWQIGNSIREDILGNEHAEYGKKIVSALSREMAAEYSKRFAEQNLWHMLEFAEVFPNKEILYALRRE